MSVEDLHERAVDQLADETLAASTMGPPRSGGLLLLGRDEIRVGAGRAGAGKLQHLRAERR
jgi:hypothetical protein